MEIASVLLPTSFSTIKLALSVWRKHKHVRAIFISMLVSVAFDPYTHASQGHPQVHIHTCTHALLHSTSYVCSYTYSYVHSHLTHNHKPRLYFQTRTLFCTHTPYTHILFSEKLYLLLTFIYFKLHLHPRKQIKSLIIPSPQSYCKSPKKTKKRKKFPAWLLWYRVQLLLLTKERYYS